MRLQILNGSWPEGSDIPSLEELSTQFGVSRTTAQKAVHILVGEGLLSAQRGRHTHVSTRSEVGKSPRVQSWLGFGLVDGKDYSAHIIERGLVDQLSNGYFIGTPDPPYMRLKKVDFIGKTPFCISVVYIVKRIFDRFPKDGEILETGRLVRDLADPPLSAAKERAIVSSADRDDAHYLDYPVSAPVAKARRNFCDTNMKVVYYAESVYRGDMYGTEADMMPYLHAE